MIRVLAVPVKSLRNAAEEAEAKQHPFKLEEGKTYQQLESVICYR